MKIWLRATMTALVAFTASAWADQLAVKKVLTLTVAKQIAAAAENESVKDKCAVVIAIVDDGGNLVYLEKMDEAQIGSIEVAREKAQSSSAFERPTKNFQDLLAGGNTMILKLPGAFPAEGGVPLVADGKTVGAIGVSGCQTHQNGPVAAAGAGALAKILTQ